MKAKIVVLGTMDTKGLEVAYMRDLIESSGHQATLVDVGLLGPRGVKPDVTSEQIARLADQELKGLIAGGLRDQAIAAMGKGAAKYLLRLFQDGAMDGVIGLGGNQGSAIVSMAMRALPIGFPKFLVSTVASGNIRPYVGHKDIAVMFSVSDLLGGPNMVTRSVLSNAVSALLGMVERGARMSLQPGEKTVAISALGNTEQAVSHAMKLLQEKGYQAISFHASGAGGSAMEELVEAGVFQGVLDLTPHELAEEVVGEGIYIPVTPGRLTAAGKKGIPQVVATGGLEYLCFGPRETIPPRLRRRKIYMHNPYNANLKISQTEMGRIGEVMAERLNQARGPVAVLIPKRGWSIYGSEGGPLHDPVGNLRLVNALRRGLREGIPCQVIDAHINDPVFVESCVELILNFMKE